jgi:glycosyltransferase involved in cell wall biosynthesis
MDTCPRTAIEAKLLGCEVICNDKVQHKDELWFQGSKENTIEYLRERAKLFWIETLSNSNLNIPSFRNNEFRNKINFKIVIPAYNAEPWIGRAVKSVLEQEYENYECIICDDISLDSTAVVCENLISEDSRFKLVKNTEKKFALKNIYDGIQMLSPDGDDVVVVLDGDDWLSSRFVLSNLASHYEKEKCWMTYGSFIEFPTAKIGIEASNYPEEVIKNNSFRDDLWRASHLKTFKASLWNKINSEDFLDDDGKFYEMTYDQAIMLPMLEMSGQRAKYIEDVNYVYNVSNPNAINKIKAQKQHNLMLKIRSKKKYERINDENLS